RGFTQKTGACGSANQSGCKSLAAGAGLGAERLNFRFGPRELNQNEALQFSLSFACEKSKRSGTRKQRAERIRIPGFCKTARMERGEQSAIGDRRFAKDDAHDVPGSFASGARR